MDNPRLRSNTFVALMIRAKRHELGSRPEWGENNGGITYAGLLSDLIRLSITTYQPKRMETLVSYFSSFMQGSPRNSPQYLPFNSPACRNGLADRLRKEHEKPIQEMNAICHKYLDMGDFNNRLLVGGILETILAEESFNGEFDTGYKVVGRCQLSKEDQFILQPFLTSVWSLILSDHPDYTEGGETYMAWSKDAGFNTARIVETDIGTERAKKITVSTDLPEELQTESVITDEWNAQKEPKDAGQIKADVIEDAQPLEHKTVVKGAKVYQQQAEKIYNIDHIENFYG